MAAKVGADELVKAEEAEVEPTDDIPWRVLLTLLGVFISNQWCRALIYYVNNFEASTGDDAAAAAQAAYRFANVDLHYGTSEYAVLASFGFTAVFAAASLLAGRLADTTDRRWLTVGTCIAWSTVTVVMGTAHSYDELLVGRALLGLSMAATAPAAYSLIADLTPKKSIATANSIYSAGIYVGGALASLAVVLDTSVGWRGTHMLVGGSGLVVALLSATLMGPDPRPSRVKAEVKADEAEAGGSLRESFMAVVSTRTLQLLFAGTALRFCAGFGLGVWKAPFYLGKFPEAAANFSVLNACIVGGVGATSALLGGRLADRLASRSASPDAARMLVPACGSLLAAPLLYAALAQDTLPASLGFLFLEYLAAECWLGPTVAGIYAALPSQSDRGTAQGFFSLLTAVGNVAPVLIGGMVAAGGVGGTGLLADTPLQDAMTWVLCGAYVSSGSLFALAARDLARRDKPREEL